MKLLPKLGFIKLYQLMRFTLKFYKQPKKTDLYQQLLKRVFFTKKSNSQQKSTLRVTLKVPFLIPFNL